ncbi:MAG: helix-turn-helix domain-containing protein [Firmicutes bacterium]|nr:helix-turn-helix domain-containing protein [Bacillota bacterium]
MNNLELIIGEKLYKLRQSKGYSLSQVEDLTGVSKSMLGQIERGKSSPTVNTLWRIAKGLNVSFSFFIEEDKQETTIVSPSEIKPIIDENNKYRVYPIFPYDKQRKLEMYILDLEPHYSHQSEAHTTGVEEYIFIHQGILELTTGEKEYTIKTGNSIHFNADKKHIYTNTTEKTTIAYLTMYYPV